MNRFVAISAVFLTGVFASVVTSMASPQQQEKMIVAVDETEFEDKVRELTLNYSFFKNTLNTTIERLSKGQIGLAEARERVYESAQRYFPDFLAHVERSEQGATPSECVARNLLGHVRSLEEHDPTLAPRVQALESEFAELYPNPAQ